MRGATAGEERQKDEQEQVRSSPVSWEVTKPKALVQSILLSVSENEQYIYLFLYISHFIYVTDGRFLTRSRDPGERFVLRCAIR